MLDTICLYVCLSSALALFAIGIFYADPEPAAGSDC